MFLSPDSIIKLYHSGLKEISETCLKCGVCCILETHHCPVQHDGRYTPRFTYVYDIIGSDSLVDNDALWQCVSCYICEELCPYDVSPIQFIEQLKKMAFREGKAAEGIVNEIRSVIGSGYTFPITDFSKRQRKELGLSRLQIEFDELGVIAERSGLLKILELYGEDKK